MELERNEQYVVLVKNLAAYSWEETTKLPNEEYFVSVEVEEDEKAA